MRMKSLDNSNNTLLKRRRQLDQTSTSPETSSADNSEAHTAL